jgi:hypothetical protein
VIPNMPWFGLGAIYCTPRPHQGTWNKKGVHTTHTTAPPWRPPLTASGSAALALMPKIGALWLSARCAAPLSVRSARRRPFRRPTPSCRSRARRRRSLPPKFLRPPHIHLVLLWMSWGRTGAITGAPSRSILMGAARRSSRTTSLFASEKSRSLSRTTFWGRA